MCDDIGLVTGVVTGVVTTSFGFNFLEDALKCLGAGSANRFCETIRIF